MAAAQVLYGVVIKDAIISRDLKKMKATAEKAKKHIREQGNLHVALLDLIDAIGKLESKK